ncbi:coiled-coil domain-containing protein [Sphingomonas sp. XXL09]|uniref:coiled-coil domain-containing protein n=1 Tax=Sphingomonas sp. XXL09 TaxID=3457787 RepID=UPI00406BC397
MRVELDDGSVVELGTVETAPTIGIIDYSRRDTDAFGITTVVERGFARRMSVRLAIPSADVDRVQQQLAAIRATAALWVADDDIASLSVRGFFKEFELDLAVPPLSYCTLTVEGLVSTIDTVETGMDAAPAGDASTLLLLDPIAIDTSVFAGSNIDEGGTAAWVASVSYAKGAQAIRNHRIWESLFDANVGHDPVEDATRWVDTGPTNTWAMFDQALGTKTHGADDIIVSLHPPSVVTGLAILDTDAGSIRVQAPGYDRTQDVDASGSVLFADLDVAIGGPILVTATAAAIAGTPAVWSDNDVWQDGGRWADRTMGGDGTVSIGTLLIGALRGIGITEASPTAGITDYSVKETDQFGETTVTPRTYAKRMTARALIDSAAVDLVAARIAAVRARPALWIGDVGSDSLTVYGFFKDFSIEIAEGVSKLSLSIEGLSEAADVAPLIGAIDWPDVGDPDGTKPADNADKTSENTSKDTEAVGGKPAGEILSAIGEIPQVQKAVEDATAAIGQVRDDAAAAVQDVDARLATARGDLDKAVGDMLAEAARAQGAEEDLAQRIENLSANGGYDDTAVRALINDVDTARADDKRAITQRVEDAETEYRGLDATTNTRIARTETALSDAQRSIAQQITEVTTDYQGLDRATNSRITNSVASLSDADQSLSQRIDALVAQGGGGSEGVDSVARSEVSRVEQAYIAADVAIGQRLDSVSASFTRSGGNLIPGSEFTTLDGWSLSVALPGTTLSRNGSGSDWFPGGVEDVMTLRQVGNNAGAYCEVMSAPFAVQPSAWYQFYVFSSSHRARNWVTLFYYDVSGAFIGYSGENMAPRYDNGGRDIRGWDQNGLKAVQAPASAVYARMVLRKYDTFPDKGDSYAWWWHPYVGEAREGQTNWNPYAVGNSRGAQLAASARIDQAATSAANASQAVANLSTSVDTRFTGVNQTLGTFDQRITGLSTDLSGYAGRATVLEAAASAGVAAARNDRFAYWTDGQRYATGWIDWPTTPPPASYIVQRVGSDLGSPYGVRTEASAGLDCGFWQVVPVSPGLWIIEVTARRVSGSLSGAGVTLSGQWNLDFLSDPDINGRVGDSVDGQIRTWSKAVSIDERTGQTVNLHAMQGWSGFGRAIASHAIVWSKLSLRPASPGDIAGIKNAADLVSVTARVRATEDVVADLPNRYAAASRVNTVEAQLNRTAASPLNSYVDAVNGRIDSVNNGTVASLNARIEDRANAIADAKVGPVAQSVQNVSTQAGDAYSRASVALSAANDAAGKLSAARLDFSAVTSGGRAQVVIRSDNANGAAVDIIGDTRFLNQNGGGNIISISATSGITMTTPGGITYVEIG